MLGWEAAAPQVQGAEQAPLLHLVANTHEVTWVEE